MTLAVAGHRGRGWLARVALSFLLAVGLGTASEWMFGPTGTAQAADPPQVAQWRADPVAGRGLPDPLHEDPATVAHFFAGLPSAKAATLTLRYPQVVGNLDGAPLALRLRANALDSAGTRRFAGRQILEYDPRGDGRVVEVVGDLARARRVAVIVPGVDNRLDNFDRAPGLRQRRSPSWQARQLYDRARALEPDVPVAVIAWLGYDPPAGVDIDAIREDRAAAGAVELIRFLAGLRQTNPHTRITVVGHSYGSVVTGLAAHGLPAQVGDIVAVGSPGMGVPTAADLHTRARVWAGSSLTDWTRDTPGLRLLGAGHDTHPADQGFGALPLPVDGVLGHDGYFVPGTASLTAIAEILLDRPVPGT
jgi:hypothetical protein